MLHQVNGPAVKNLKELWHIICMLNFYLLSFRMWLINLTVSGEEKLFLKLKIYAIKG